MTPKLNSENDGPFSLTATRLSAEENVKIIKELRSKKMRSITIQQFLCSLSFDDQSSAEQEEEKLKWWRKIEQF